MKEKFNKKICSLNLSQQIKSKYFWLSVVSLIVLVSQTFGLTCIPDNFEELMNSLLTIFVGLGILNNNGVVDE